MNVVQGDKYVIQINMLSKSTFYISRLFTYTLVIISRNSLSYPIILRTHIRLCNNNKNFHVTVSFKIKCCNGKFTNILIAVPRKSDSDYC